MGQRNYDALILDMDGTIYLSDVPLPGALEAIARVRRSGATIRFLTNKPLFTRRAYARKLKRLGFGAAGGEVVTSAHVMEMILARDHPGKRVFVLGEAVLRRKIARAGCTVVRRGEDADILVASFDRTLTYRKLNEAVQALLSGARFFATNPDVVCPVAGGVIPDSGSLIAALRAATKRDVELLTGKPSEVILEVALADIHAPKKRCLLVGDRLETDITMGARFGIPTALVLTGVASRDDLESAAVKPDYVLESISELPDIVNP